MTTKPSLSVIILTLNEELNLEKCLRSVSGWVSEIIVVDSYSTDKTLEIAKRYNARVVQHPFKYQADQFNWALDNVPIKTEWILRLDADEYLLPELREEIAEMLPKTPQDVNGYYMKRRVIFMGRWIKHGGYYPVWFLRLFRKEKGRYENREMDEHLIVEGKTVKLEHNFVDHNLKGLNEWIARHNNYSACEARAYLKFLNLASSQDARLGGQVAKKRRAKNELYYKMPPFFRALLYWKYRYFLRLGFLDGKEGLIFHFLQGFWYRFLVDAKLYEYKRSKKRNRR